MQVLPSPTLGLALPPAEFVVDLRLWLGIPVFRIPEADRTLCSCHQLIDCFGDHLTGPPKGGGNWGTLPWAHSFGGPTSPEISLSVSYNDSTFLFDMHKVV